MARHFWKLTIVMVMAALGSICILATAWGAEYVSVAREGVNLRSGPGMDQTVLFELPAGYPLQVLSRENSWLKVQDVDGDKGWIAASTVNTSPMVIVTAATVNLRGGSGTQDRVVGTAAKGTILGKLDRKGDWIKVSHPGLKGAAWVSKGYIWPRD